MMKTFANESREFRECEFMKRRLVYLFTILTCGGLLGCSQGLQPVDRQGIAGAPPSTAAQPAAAAKRPAAVPAYVTNPEILKHLPPTLPSSRFSGPIRES